jgi:DNA-binding MarR family transcriptional regulator
VTDALIFNITALVKISASVVPAEQARQVGESCLCLHVQRAGRALARRFDEALRPCGLSSWQFSILMSLSASEPPSLGVLAEWLVMDRTTLTANLKPLERRGLVRVRPDQQDRRVRRLSLSKSGRSLLARALPLWEAAQREAEACLGTRAPALRQALSSLSREPTGLRAL